MTDARPAIPTETTRQILVEAGHRCAVCGESTPLERAHIRPWRESRSHSVEDLICLCANCHQRADNEHWGEKTLLQYKRKPWVLRRGPEYHKRTLLVTLKLDIGIDSFEGDGKTILISELAKRLGIDEANIRVAAIEFGSVIVTLELPAVAAEKLIDDLRNPASGLTGALFRAGLPLWCDRKTYPSQLKRVLSAGEEALGRENYDHALDLFESARAFAKQLDDARSLISADVGVATAYEGQRLFERSLPFHHEALQLAEEVGERKLTADQCFRIGRVLHSTRDTQKATEYLRRAIDIHRRLGLHLEVEKIIRFMGENHLGVAGSVDPSERFDAEG